MNQSQALVLAAVVLGAAILGGSFLIKSSLDAGASELEGVRTSLADFKGALQAAARPTPAAAAPRRGPDPEKVHAVSIAGAPAKGIETAKVTLVEFSDFQ